MRTTIFLKFSYLQEMQYIILCNIFLNLSLAYILLELSIFSTDAMNRLHTTKSAILKAEMGTFPCSNFEQPFHSIFAMS